MKTRLLVAFICLLGCQFLSAQEKKKFNEDEYITRKGDTLKINTPYILGKPTGTSRFGGGARYNYIYYWSSGPIENEPAPALHRGKEIKIIKFKKRPDGIVYALFETKGWPRYGIAVESAIEDGEFLIRPLQ